MDFAWRWSMKSMTFRSYLFAGLGLMLLASPAAASSPEYGVYGVYPEGELPSGSTVLVEGFQIQGELAAAEFYVEGELVEHGVRGTIREEGENEGVLSPVVQVSEGQSVEVRVGQATETLRVVAPDTEAPPAPSGTHLVLDGLLEQDPDVLSGQVRYTLRYDQLPGDQRAWERTLVRMYPDSSNGELLAGWTRTTEDAAEPMVYRPPAYKLEGRDPAAVCFDVQAVDGAGNESEIVTACVAEDLRSDDFSFDSEPQAESDEGADGCSCRSGGDAAASTALLFLLGGLVRRKRRPSRTSSRGC